MESISTCACECDMWCKPGQYLDHKNCVCKNQLIGRVIAKCTNVINETMMNNRDNIANNNTITYVFIGLFVVLFIGAICFCLFAYFKWFKDKKLFKNKCTDYGTYKNGYKVNWDDIVYINDFHADLLKIIKRESRIGTNIYYIGCILEPYCLDITIKPLYFVINCLIGYIEEIEGSSDKYLVVSKSIHNNKIIHSFDTIWKII